jgi:hypothetical protein
MQTLQQSFLKPPRHNKRFEDLFAFHCRAFKLPDPEEQYRFALTLGRQFRADFAWPKYQLLVEVEGGIWRRGGGAHSHPINVERNIEKHQHAALLGYIVLPVTTDEVKTGKGIELAMRVLIARGWTP